MKNEAVRNIFAIVIILALGAGVALAGSQGSFQANGLPVYAIGVALAFLIQWSVFIPAYILRTEKFFDLAGSLTYLTVVIAALFISPVQDARSWLVVALVAIWALRLGSFLFIRVLKAGEDRRFREIKQSFFRFERSNSHFSVSCRHGHCKVYGSPSHWRPH
jgi:steroid 5-alpha reductase family enzyme